MPRPDANKQITNQAGATSPRAAAPGLDTKASVPQPTAPGSGRNTHVQTNTPQSPGGLTLGAAAIPRSKLTTEPTMSARTQPTQLVPTSSSAPANTTLQLGQWNNKQTGSSLTGRNLTGERDAERQRLTTELETAQSDLTKMQTQYGHLQFLRNGYDPEEKSQPVADLEHSMWDLDQKIQKRNTEIADLQTRLDEVNKPIEWEGRQELIDELNRIDENSGWITDPDAANVMAQRRAEIEKTLQERDLEFGNGLQHYNDVDLAREVIGGASKDYASGMLNAAGTALAAAYEGADTNPYAGWATDELSAENIGYEHDENAMGDFRFVQTGAEKLQAAADRLGESAAADLESAKAGLGKFGQAGVDIATNIIQMGFDAATGVTGINPLAAMFIRSSGSASREARLAGADTSQQLMFGVAKGTIEVVTEKLLDGVAGIYGKGTADEITEQLIRKLTNSDLGRSALRLFIGAAGEGGEEVLSDIFSPLAEKLYKDESLKELYRQLEPSEVLYDFLIGAVIGGFGGAASIATGADTAKNAELRMQDNIDIIARALNLEETGESISDVNETANPATRVNREGESISDVNRTAENNVSRAGESLSNVNETREEDLNEEIEQGTEETEPGLLEPEETQQATAEDGLRPGEADNIETESEDGTAAAVSEWEELPDGDEGRDAGERAGGEPEGLDGDAGTGGGEPEPVGEGRNAAGQSLGDALRETGEVEAQSSAAYLGIQNGTENKTFLPVPDKDLTPELKQVQYSVNMAAGAGVDFVAGPIEVKGANGKTYRTSGIYNPETRRVTIQVDNAKYTPAEIADRQKFLIAAQRDPGLTDEIRDRIVERFGRSEMQRVLRNYIVNMRGAYDIGDGSIDAMDTAARTILNQVFADANAGINSFDADTRKYRFDTKNAMSQRADQQTGTEPKRERGKVRLATRPGMAGGVRYSAVNREGLTGTQRATIRVAETIANATGLDIRVVDMGKGYGGEYFPGSGGVMYLNISASLGGKNIAAASMSHELTHWLQEYAKDEYATLKQVVLSEIQKDPARFESIFTDREETYGNIADLTEDQITDEMVANACQTVLMDPDTVRRIVSEQPTLAERIRNFIIRMIDDIKEAFSEMPDTDRSIFQEVKAAEGALDQIRETWLNAFDTAAENLKAEQGANKKAATEGGSVQYSLWQFEDGRRYVNVDIDQEQFEGLSIEEKQKLAKKIIKQRFAGKVIGEDNRAFVNGRTASEYARPAKNIDDDAARTAKMHASTELDNLIDAGFNYRTKADGADGHYHKGAKGWHYYDTLFRFGKEFFQGTLNIMETKAGKRLTDVTQIKNVTEDIASSYGVNPKSDFLRNTSEAIVSEEDEDVKGAERQLQAWDDIESEKEQEQIQRVQYSRFVEDPETLDFLDKQEEEGKVVHTYKSFLEIDGKLYPPMASMKKDENGKWKMTKAMEVGRWEESVGDPSKIIVDPKNGRGYFNLKKDNGDTVKAAYNPYQHSSNLMLNDQFTGAYSRPNLVTYECIIPESELTSGYRAEYAKDPVGEHSWKAGPVAGKLVKAKGTERKVYLSRWLKPIRKVPDAEVAQHYKELLDGTDIAVPSNVVPPSLLRALEDAGVNIEYDERAPKTEAKIINAGTGAVEIDPETESANVQYSLLTWEESDYVQERNKAAKEIAQALGISQRKARDYIDSINSVAKMIAEEKGRLDYEDTGRSPFVSNTEYGGSFDFTTLCKKRRLLTGTFSAIQRALPNTALTANEILEIRKMMDEAGLEVSCGKCYVEGSRASMGTFTKEFLNLYKKYNPGAWVPNMAEMNTPDGIEWVRQTHPEVYEQYEYFWNHYGTLRPGDPNLFASQQKPKLYQMRSAYKGEVLEHFKRDGSIDEKNRNGGMRMQSFSDFEIVHLIDAMQVIMDMSRVGLNGQAYTKVPDFAWALGKTGLKINLSIDAWDVDENGNLVFNNKEGMNFDEAMRIRDANSENVGTICCVYDDRQLLAALADDRIDFIIPFHRSQWKKSQYKAMGLPATTKDYTYQQNEKWLDKSKHTHEYRGRQVPDRCQNYMPNEYWDFSKSGKENAEEYLRMCARDGKRPKFYRFLDNNGNGSYSLKADGSTDGYWKLLIDFKMYDNEGRGSPQRPVRPDFNMEEINRMLTGYEGGHNQFPVANGIVDEFVQNYKDRHQGQTQFQKWNEDQLTMEGFEEDRRSDWDPEMRRRDEEAEQLTEDVQEYFRNVDEDSEFFMDEDEILEAMDYDRYGDSYGGDMGGADEVLQCLSELSADQAGAARRKTYELMERIVPHLSAVSQNNWTGDGNENEVYDERFTKWYSKRHPSLYYPGYQPGDLFDRGGNDDQFWTAQDNKEKERNYLIDLLEDGKLMEPELSEARRLLDRLDEGNEVFYQAYEDLDVEIRNAQDERDALQERLNGITERDGVYYDGGEEITEEEIRSLVTELQNADDRYRELQAIPREEQATPTEEPEPEGLTLGAAEEPEEVPFIAEDERDRTIRELQAANRDLEKYAENWRKQASITGEGEETAKRSDVKRVTKDLIEHADYQGDKTELQRKIQALADMVVSNNRGSGLNWNEIRAAAREIADNLVDNSYTILDPEADTRNAIKAALKEMKIRPDAMWTGDFGDWENFRRQNIGTLVFSREGRSIDDVYKELRGSFGEGLFPADITAGSDQVNQIIKALDSLRPQQSYNFADDTEAEMASDYYTNRITDEVLFGDIREELTKADRNYRRVKERMRKAEEQLKKVKRESNQRIQDLQRMQRHEIRGALEKQRADARAREERQKIRKNIDKTGKRLIKYLRENSGKNPIPEPLKEAVGKVLLDLDISGGMEKKQKERYFRDMQDIGKIVAQQNAYMAGQTDKWDGLLLDLPSDIQQELNEHLANVQAAMDEAEARGRVWNPNMMNLEELQRLDEILTVLTSAITNANEILSDARGAKISEEAEAAIREIDALGEDKPRKKIKEKIRRFLQFQNTTPYYFFKRLGNSGQRMFKRLMDGWDKFAFNAKQVIDFANETYTKEEAKEILETVFEFNLRRRGDLSDGFDKPEKVTMTKAQIMSLYCLWKREQAQGHLLGAGIRIADYEQGNTVVKQAENYLLDLDDVMKIISKLTDRDRQIADALQKYMNTVGSDWGNEVSMKRFGIRSFTEENYFPISTDDRSRQLRNQESEEANLYRLLNMSFTKATTRGASNSVVIDNIFDVFANHMADMAKYNGLGLPMLDAMKWVSYSKTSELSESGQYGYESVQKSMDRAFGKEARNYFTAFMKDLNGVREGGRGEEFGSRLLSSYKVAAVGANLRVAVLQPTSFMRASAVLDKKYLLQGLKGNNKQAQEEATKYSGTANWKDMGFYDTNINAGLREMIKHTGGVTDDIREKSMKLAETMDKVTWGALWNACKAEQEDKGFAGEELMQATAERFREVVYRTQVMDSTMTRSHVMRQKGTYAGMVTAFMSEPTLSYNMLLDAYNGYEDEVRKNMDGKDQKDQKALKTARDKAWEKSKDAVGKAASAYMATAILSAIVESLVDAARDDDEYSTYLERFLEKFTGVNLNDPDATAWEIFKGFMGGNFMEDLMLHNKVPIVKDFFAALSGNSTNRMDIEAFGTLVKAAGIAWESIALAVGWQKEPTKLTYNGNMTTWGKIYNILRGVSQMSGLPLGNATRDLIAIWNTTVGEIASSAKIQTYDPGAEKSIQYAVQDGYLTEDEAVKLLVEKEIAEDEEEARQTAFSWANPKRYERLLTAMNAGDKEEFQAAKQELEDLRFKHSGITAAVIGDVEKQFLGEEDREPINREEAVKLLMDYGGMVERAAETKVQRWTCELETGIPYSGIGDAYVDGDITAKQAKEMLMEYGDMAEEKAEAQVQKWKAEIDTGIAYGDIGDSLLYGDITKEEAIRMLMKYGGKSQEDAEDYALQIMFQRDYGMERDRVTLQDMYINGEFTRDEMKQIMLDYSYSNTEKSAENSLQRWDFIGNDMSLDSVTPNQAKAWFDGLEDSGIDKHVFLEFAKQAGELKADTDENGKSIMYSKMDKLFNLIDGLDLTNEQKDALVLLYGYEGDGISEKNLSRAPWHDGTTSSSGGKKKSSGKRSGGGGGRRGGYGGGRRGGGSGGGLSLGNVDVVEHSDDFEDILKRWRKRKLTRKQILQLVKEGKLTQEEADEILGTEQDGAEGDEDLLKDTGLKLGAAEEDLLKKY